MAATKLLFLVSAIILVQGTYCKNSLTSILEESKIVGGHETSISKLPFQVFVYTHNSNGSFICGGSILNEEYILTAAHCIYGKQSVEVGAGSTERETVAKIPLIPAKCFVYHPLYNDTTADYDVAYIQLSKPLNLDGLKEKAVHIVQAGSKVPVGAKVTVSGWGNTAENGSLSDVLRAVELNIISVVECRKYYGKETITQRMICAGVREGGKDTCQGDSGGPLVYSSTRKQVGIVSSGYGCARPGVPGIYTNLANPGIRSWIKKHTGA
ncbi:trypsin 5G1-like isoform X3 [Leptidea sinapis]|uniref:trypsin 5G1-like isoform X3 n=1 Tax=Leptidea sinapis TaxID=189913 RepID=UPI0021C343FC|nr:trypsin 5G1-like isoform X3 [Leptidea sinapis]